MRPGQQKQRGRGRNSGGGSNNNNNNSNNQRKGQNPLTRTYDSSGPDVKIRGTAQHIAEKYMALARDATSSGDRVMAENYLQHAEHYNRIIAAAQAMFQERVQRDDRAEYSNERGDQGDQGERGEMSDRGDMNDRDERDEDDNDGQQPSESENRDRQAENNNRRSENQNRQHVAVEQPVVIDQSTPQPVFEDTPAEVQIEQEAAAGEQTERAPRRRSNAGRPRRTPRQPRGEAEAPGQAAEKPEPVDVPAE